MKIHLQQYENDYKKGLFIINDYSLRISCNFVNGQFEDFSSKMIISGQKALKYTLLARRFLSNPCL